MHLDSKTPRRLGYRIRGLHFSALRSLSLVVLFFIALVTLYQIRPDQPQKFCIPVQSAVQPGSHDVTTKQQCLSYIPPYLWQILLSEPHEAADRLGESTLSWINTAPSYKFSFIDTAAAHELVVRLANKSRKYRNALAQFYLIPRRVMRVDFIRYLVLALEGGAYGDTDTELVRPVHEWVPEDKRAVTKLIVGLESDASPPTAGTTYEVQFSQWTISGAKDHPVFWAMIDRIFSELDQRLIQSDISSELTTDDHGAKLRSTRKLDFSDEDVLEITGPAGWTQVIYTHLSLQSGRNITWQDLHGMKEPRLFGDTLVLPIDGFGTGLPHSGSSPANTEQTMVRHYFAGSWRGGEK